MTTYSIQVLNSDYKIVKIVDEFSQVDIVLVYNGASKYVVDFPYSDEIRVLGTNYQNYIRILRNDIEIVSGKISGYERTYNSAQNLITLSGEDNTNLLKTRLALPVTDGPPYTTAAYDTQTGAAETVIKHYVNVNAGPGAISSRKISGLTIQTDGGLGETITGWARFNGLFDLISNLAVSGGVGFKFSGLEFQVYQPADKTKSIILSADRGNISGFSYSEEIPSANFSYCGGSGTGVGRSFFEGGDWASIIKYGRIETFIDQKQTDDLGEMQQLINQQIEKGAATVGLTLTPVSFPGLEFIEDYGLGDQVTAIIDGNSLTAIVREVNISIGKTGSETVSPVIGSYNATNSIFSLLKQDTAINTLTEVD